MGRVPLLDWDAIVGTEEAAGMLRISVERVKQLCRSGSLEARKINGSWVISRQSVEERMEAKPKAGRPKKA